MFTASLALPPPQTHFPFLPALPFLLFPPRNVAGRQVERLRKALRWDVAPVLTDFNPGASRYLPCCLPCCCACCLPNFRPPQAVASSTDDACRCRSQAASHLAVSIFDAQIPTPNLITNPVGAPLPLPLLPRQAAFNAEAPVWFERLFDPFNRRNKFQPSGLAYPAEGEGEERPLRLPARE
jgi:hypothetical protein